MATTDDGHPEPANAAGPTHPGSPPAEIRAGSSAIDSGAASHPDQPATDPVTKFSSTVPSAAAGPPPHRGRKWLLLFGAIVGLTAAGYFLYPVFQTMLNTVSTDDAYVNGHVTLVAPRVAGQVSRVLVDDNYRVKKGSLLVQLDKEPFQVQVAIKTASVRAAEADLVAARAQVRGLEAMGGSQRWQLQSAMEQVNNQVANLRADVATYKSKLATLDLARANLKRGEQLLPSGGISKEELDVRRQTVKVDEAAVEQALQAVYATRVYLGLPPQPAGGRELTEVPPNLDQTFSAVRSALYSLIQTTAQVGLDLATDLDHVTPQRFLEDFRKRDASGDLDRILKAMVPNAPAVKQAEAKLLQARHDLDQAELNLRYCDIISEIDGVITRRNVNPGNNVAVGQSLMAVRSITEIWVDANFKETQLADLRIGQRVRCEVDMYGKRQDFDGRITGFTMGTGQTLSLLPPQNATGNFVKIVQRLPVRIELTDYDPDKTPLFVGLSVVPYVYFKEPPIGPHAGEFLQPLRPLPEVRPEPRLPTGENSKSPPKKHAP
jgi:membrane fusion protein (multidrug efflux system)